MNYAENNKQRQAMATWLADRDFTVFGRLKFTDGHRTERAVFMHTGTSQNNLHYHIKANPAKDIGMFCETARCVWDETSSFTMGYENTLICGVRSLDRTASYCVHEYQTHGADTLHLSTTHQKKVIPVHNPIYAMRRMLKRQQQNELIKEPAWMHSFLR